MEIFLLWLGCAILCAVVAPGRGRSGAGWFFIGLIFGVFGVIALLAMPNLAQLQFQKELMAPRPPRRDPDDIRLCRHCAEEIRRAAKVCKHCGGDVELRPQPVPEAIHVTAMQAPDKPFQCPACGTRQPYTNTACCSCGKLFAS